MTGLVLSKICFLSVPVYEKSQCKVIFFDNSELIVLLFLQNLGLELDWLIPLVIEHSCIVHVLLQFDLYLLFGSGLHFPIFNIKFYSNLSIMLCLNVLNQYFSQWKRFIGAWDHQCYHFLFFSNLLTKRFAYSVTLNNVFILKNRVSSIPNGVICWFDLFSESTSWMISDTSNTTLLLVSLWLSCSVCRSNSGSAHVGQIFGSCDNYSDPFHHVLLSLGQSLDIPLVGRSVGLCLAFIYLKVTSWFSMI